MVFQVVKAEYTMQPQVSESPPATSSSGAKVPGFPRWEEVVAADPKYPKPEDLRRAARSNLESVTIWRYHVSAELAP